MCRQRSVSQGFSKMGEPSGEPCADGTALADKMASPAKAARSRERGPTVLEKRKQAEEAALVEFNGERRSKASQVADLSDGTDW